MGWHGQDPSAITDIKAFEIEQFAAKLYPEVKENMSTSFLIFSRWIFC
jgi:peptidyl-dipeptidase Dcp